MPCTTRAPQPAYRPRVMLTATRSVYRVESERMPGVTYRVDAVAGTCTCPAGQWEKPCKHARIGLMVWEAQRQMCLAARNGVTTTEAAGAFPVAA